MRNATSVVRESDRDGTLGLARLRPVGPAPGTDAVPVALALPLPPWPAPGPAAAPCQRTLFLVSSCFDTAAESNDALGHNSSWAVRDTP